jgi:hypothetical protein
MNELITITNGIASLNPETAQQIAEFERKAKEIKDAEDALRAEILKEMEAKNILSLETEEIKISYKSQYDRESFDSKTFRNEHADLYDSYVRMTPVKSSIVIKVK